MNVFITSALVNAGLVIELADRLKAAGHLVVHFADPDGPRLVVREPAPPFDPKEKTYSEFLNQPEWVRIINEKQAQINKADVVVLVLPSGENSNFELGYAKGIGKPTVIMGEPENGEYFPVHLMADLCLPTSEEVVFFVRLMQVERDKLKEADTGVPARHENPQGLHKRYVVRKIHGATDPKAEYFVLRMDGGGDPDSVKAARFAISRTYADEIEPTQPKLAADLRERYGSEEG